MTTKTIFALLMVFLLAAVAVNAEVYINEVMVNPSEGNDFVELYNDGETVSLDNWTIRDADDVLKTFGTEDTITDYVVIDVSNKLINSGNSVSLYNADILIDKINYGSVEEDNVTHLEAPEEDEVLVRVHDGNENWTISSTATPGAINNRVPVIGEPEDDITGSSENVTLNIIGYSFSDSHINSMILEAFKTNPSLRLVIVWTWLFQKEYEVWDDEKEWFIKKEWISWEEKSYFNKINVLVEIAPIEEETSSKELKEFMFIAQEFIQLSLHPYRKIVKGIPEQGILSFSFVEE